MKKTLAFIFLILLSGNRLHAEISFLEIGQLLNHKNTTTDQFTVGNGLPEGYLVINIEGYNEPNIGAWPYSSYFPRLAVSVNTPAFSNSVYSEIFAANQGESFGLDIYGNKLHPGINSFDSLYIQKVPAPISTADVITIAGFLSSVNYGETSDLSNMVKFVTDGAGLLGGTVAVASASADKVYTTLNGDLGQLLHTNSPHNYVASQASFTIATSKDEAQKQGFLRPGAILFYDAKLAEWIKSIYKSSIVNSRKWEWDGKSLSYDGHYVPNLINRSPYRSKCSYILLKITYTPSVIKEDDIPIYTDPSLYPQDSDNPPHLKPYKVYKTVHENLGGSLGGLTSIRNELQKCQIAIDGLWPEINNMPGFTNDDKKRLYAFYKKKIDQEYDDAFTYDSDLTALINEAKTNKVDFFAIIHFPEIVDRIKNNPTGSWSKFEKAVNNPGGKI